MIPTDASELTLYHNLPNELDPIDMIKSTLPK